MTGQTYLITGANRGIGRGLFDNYVAQPGNTIIAVVRNTEGAQDLLNVPKGDNTRVILAKVDASSKTDPYDAAKHIQAEGVDYLNVIVACAGIAKFNTIEDTSLEELEEILMINTISVVLLYKAMLPLLRKSPTSPRFVFISGASGSLNSMRKFSIPIGSFGASKALGNYLVARMGMENDWLITLMINPGLVQTDMGYAGARAAGKDRPPRTLSESTTTTAYIIDHATKEEHSEKFFDETIDKIHPW